VQNYTLQSRIHVDKSITYVRQLSPPNEHPEQTSVSGNIDGNSSDTTMILNCRQHV